MPVAVPSDDPLDGPKRISAALKKVALMVVGTAMQRFGEELRDEQEVLSFTADIVIDAFATESATLRAEASAAAAPRHADAAQVIADTAAARCEAAAREALAAMAEGDALRTQLSALRRLLRAQPGNSVAARRRLAETALDRAGYMFEG